MSRRIKWGVLGTASIAWKQTITGMQKAENACLYAIAGRNPEKTAHFQKEFRFEKAYGSLDALLEDENVDAVYIPLPNHKYIRQTFLFSAGYCPAAILQNKSSSVSLSVPRLLSDEPHL